MDFRFKQFQMFIIKTPTQQLQPVVKKIIILNLELIGNSFEHNAIVLYDIYNLLVEFSWSGAFFY